MGRRPEDRYEPVPGLLSLPGFLWRRTPRWGRWVIGVSVVALIVAAVVEVPRIQEMRRENAARDRREAAQAAARERTRLIADQAAHRGRGSATGTALAQRLALVAALQEAITADARARFAAGTLPGPRVRETLCRPGDGPGADAADRRGGLLMRCIAATSAGGGDAGSEQVVVGFEFVGAVNLRRGTFTWCKTNPAAGEKFGGAALAAVPLAAACLDERR